MSTESPGFSDLERARDRLATVNLDLVRQRRASRTIFNLQNDANRILGSRVVACNDGGVSVQRGGCAHERALLRVSVSPTAEHHDHAALGDVLDRKDRLLERVGRVSVVHDHREPLAGLDPLEPTRYLRRRSKTCDDRRQTGFRSPSAQPAATSALLTLYAPAKGRATLAAPCGVTSVNDAPVADSSSPSARTIASGCRPTVSTSGTSVSQ